MLWFCNVVWHCVVLRSAVWYCGVLRGAAWCCVMLRDAAWCCVMLRDAAWCCVMLRDAAWCCVVLRGAAWCCVVCSESASGSERRYDSYDHDEHTSIAEVLRGKWGVGGGRREERSRLRSDFVKREILVSKIQDKQRRAHHHYHQTTYSCSRFLISSYLQLLSLFIQPGMFFLSLLYICCCFSSSYAWHFDYHDWTTVWFDLSLSMIALLSSPCFLYQVNFVVYCLYWSVVCVVLMIPSLFIHYHLSIFLHNYCVFIFSTWFILWSYIFSLFIHIIIFFYITFSEIHRINILAVFIEQ